MQDLKCSDIEKALLDLEEGIVFERKILFSWDDNPLKTNIFIPWHISYTSNNIRALLKAQTGNKAGEFSGGYPLVTPNEDRFFDSLHSQAWNDSIASLGSNFPSWDDVADRTAEDMGPIVSGIIVDNVEDLELKTIRVDRLRIVYIGTDLTKYLDHGQKVGIDNVLKKYGLEIEREGDKNYW
jgi:hypothetical protein